MWPISPLGQVDATIKGVFMKYYTFENVFTYTNLLNAYHECTKGVKWKASVQRYMIKAPYKVSQLYKKLYNGTYKLSPYHIFTTIERGKEREITSSTFEDRVVQKCLCNNFLVPRICPSFIYDNSASQKKKGVHFALKRCKVHFYKALRDYGVDSYILQFDFHHYFASMSHEVIKKKLEKFIQDDRLKALTFSIIDTFGDVGMGLGSQVSQTLALLYPSDLDHLIKEKLHIKYYGRYMDDGYAFCKTKEECYKILEAIQNWCNENKMCINTKKTSITKLTKGFIFIKKHFFRGRRSNLVVTLCKKNITAMRRKLLLLKKRGLDISTMIKCYYASYKRFNAYYQLRRLNNIILIKGEIS